MLDAALDFRERFRRTAAVIDAGAAEGLHSGAQVYVSMGGRVVGDAGLGLSREGMEIDADSILLWLSMSKPVAAVAIARCWERGLLELDDPVARHIPEFAANGKERIALRHLLTHTSGIRWADYLHTMPWDQIIERICQARPEPRWELGKTAGYHAFTSWYLLGEIVRRLDPAHRAYCRIVREEIFQPLGMKDCWASLTQLQYDDYGDRICLLHNTGQGHTRPLSLDTRDGCMLCVPGASGRGPMRQLGRFYEMLLNRGAGAEGVRILLPQTVEALTAKHRTGLFDLSFKHVVDWGLGVIVNSSQYGEATVPYGFGPHASARAFGHGGSQSSTGMADPEHGLVICVVFNGMPGEIPHHRRMRATLGAIYEDLNLAEPSMK